VSDTTLAIETFVEQMFGENAYVISTTSSDGQRVGWVIDPGLSPQSEQLLAYVQSELITLEKIILTHGHADHIAGLDTVHAAHPQSQVLIADADRAMLTDSQLNLSAPFGFDVVLETGDDGDIQPGMELLLGQSKWVALDTSGHSPGGRSLYCPQARVVFTGDALFAGSIGRTDFPGSDHTRLIRNIREQLLSLPPETVIYSGHGPTSTIGNERKSNPFLSESLDGY
jgi:glyoxylase-like metal-dependent hydrolase (beta-lactamase superfamily II)